jgi:hypothetical protein
VVLSGGEVCLLCCEVGCEDLLGGVKSLVERGDRERVGDCLPVRPLMYADAVQG